MNVLIRSLVLAGYALTAAQLYMIFAPAAIRAAEKARNKDKFRCNTKSSGDDVIFMRDQVQPYSTYEEAR